MLPGAGEVPPPLMTARSGRDPEVRARLAKLFGLRDHVGRGVAVSRLKGELEPNREEPGRVSSVQYVRFKVPDAQALLRGPAAVVIDHPAYTHRATLPEAVRRSLSQDLS